MASALRRRGRRRRAIPRTTTCGASGRSGSTPRSCATACWRSAATSIWRSAASRFSRIIPKDILAGQYRGKWENTPEGPAAWRRGVYVYQRRSLPYPMFDTFDHPDMNVTAGARNVSTVPTQALTLLNNPFVLSEAQVARRSRAAVRRSDPYAQVDAGLSHRAGAAARRRPRSAIGDRSDQEPIARIVHARRPQPRRVPVHEVSACRIDAAGTSGTGANSCSGRAAASAVSRWRTC